MTKLMEKYPVDQKDDAMPMREERELPRTAWHYSTKILVLSTFIVAVNVFYWLAFYIKFDEPASAERSILLYLHQYETPLFNFIAMAICTLVTTTSVTVLIYLLYRRRWQAAFFWLAATAGAAILSGIAKKVVHRLRPEFWDVFAPQASFGFPSGHATESMAIFIAALFLIRTPRIRLAVIAMAVFLVPLVGVCRLYLGVHYPTDILAGWALSLAWVSALGIACNIFSMDNVVHTRPLLHKNFLLKDPY